MTDVRLQSLSKHFTGTAAVNNITLTINPGELFFLLGPSGCGKSTLLRLIAGLHSPDSGTIHFGDRDVTHLGTEKRNAVMCFQSYALWPHMTVRDNISFGLKVRNLSPAEQDSRIAEVLKLVQMETYANRKPNQLSGGQQQRVALARALAVRPDCLLLDEPLSNLDTKLRVEMRAEIRRICKSAGCTTIYVTHDQKEALSTADRIAVMRNGQLEQVGSPSQLYDSPANSFVAAFMGETNLIAGKVATDGFVETPIGRFATRDTQRTSRGVLLSIRPEKFRLAAPTSQSPNRVSGKIIESTYLGESTEHLLDISGQRLRIITTQPRTPSDGTLSVEFDPHDVTVLPE